MSDSYSVLIELERLGGSLAFVEARGNGVACANEQMVVDVGIHILMWTHHEYENLPAPKRRRSTMIRDHTSRTGKRKGKHVWTSR